MSKRSEVVKPPKPGTWPDLPATDELRARLRREQARRAAVLGSIRAELEEEPSPNLVRACARRWCADITALADSITRARQNPEANE